MTFLQPVGYDDIALLKDTSYSTMPCDMIRQMISESIAKRHNDSYFELFAAMNDTCCVGFVSLYEYSDTEISCGPEIKPAYRKQGFAYAAVVLALEHAKHIGFTAAVAQVKQDNAASIALHKRVGFHIEAEFMNKKGNPVYWFRKTL